MNDTQLHRSSSNYESSSTETLLFNENSRACSHAEKNNQSNAQSSPLIASKLNHALRVIILFTMGSVLAFVLNVCLYFMFVYFFFINLFFIPKKVLQMEYKSNLFPSNVLIFLKTTWWVIPFCGFVAGIDR
jgi:hypothetical protein